MEDMESAFEKAWRKIMEDMETKVIESFSPPYSKLDIISYLPLPIFVHQDFMFDIKKLAKDRGMLKEDVDQPTIIEEKKDGQST